jgi:hypothetical protein
MMCAVPEANSKSSEGEEGGATSVLERQLRASALDYRQRFLGHCNTTTDIKEANFLGPDATYIAAGSVNPLASALLVIFRYEVIPQFKSITIFGLIQSLS